jgi:hypothetical protein
MNLKCDVMMDFKDQSASVTDEGLRGTFWLYRLNCPTPMRLSQSVGFYEPNSQCTLNVSREDRTTEDYIRPGNIICLSDRLSIAQPQLGALLHPVHDPTSTLPKYRYGTVAQGNLQHFEKMRESLFGSLFTGVVQTMGSLLMRAEEEYAEILIT